MEQNNRIFLEAFNNVDDKLNDFTKAWNELFDAMKDTYEPKEDSKDVEV